MKRLILLLMMFAPLHSQEKTMLITVKNTTFEVALENNPSAQALVKLLPLSTTMKDLNRNEKFYYLSSSLPANAQSVGNISVGDIMLYGDNCLVIFYESFATSYRYTKLGKINNISGLKQALGSGDIAVSFSKPS